MKSILIFSTLLMSIFLFSCGGVGLVDNCTSAVEINSSIAEETDQLATALTQFGADQSESNCSNVVSAYKEYIDALKSLQGCANQAGVGSEFSNSLTEAENSLQEFDCG